MAGPLLVDRSHRVLGEPRQELVLVENLLNVVEDVVDLVGNIFDGLFGIADELVCLTFTFELVVIREVPDRFLDLALA